MRRSRRRRALGAFGLCGALSLALLAPLASAQEDPASEQAPAPVLMAVDAGSEPFVVLRSPSRPTDVEITVNGVAASVETVRPLAEADVAIQTAIIIDNSVHTEDLLDDFVDAATDYVRRAPDNEEIAIYTTGGSGRVRLGFNLNRDRTVGALEGTVVSTEESMLWDAVRGASLALGADGQAGRSNLIVFAGSVDGGSTADAITARGAAITAQASAFAVAYDDPSVPLGSLARLADATLGGAFAQIGDVSLISAYGSSLSEVVGGTYLVEFSSDVIDAGQSLAIAVDGRSIDATYVPGTFTTGAALAPIAERAGGGIGFLRGDTGRNLGLVLGAMAAGLGAYALATLVQKNPSGLDSVLLPYADPFAAQLGEQEKTGFAKSLLLKRAVEITEGFAERRGVLVRVEAMLERADLPLRAGEAMTAMAGVVFGSFVVGLLLGRTLIAGLVFALLGVLVPPAVVNFLAGRREKAFRGQLPDTLQLLSSTLKAGYSFMQGVEAVSQEVEEPMGGELRRVMTEAQLGRPVEEALDASAERMDSPDFAWAIMAVRIQREVGGNLSELLLTVADTMTARERLRRDVAALTAEGKISAIVLGALPVLLGVAMYVINPDYISTLFEDSFGKIILGVSVVAALAGFAWMKKIINIDI